MHGLVHAAPKAGLGAVDHDQRLLPALGADRRDQSSARPELVQALEGMQVEILDARHNAYYWIRIHTGVEAEHFDAALSGVNRALGFYAGKHDLAQVTGRFDLVHSFTVLQHLDPRRAERTEAARPPRRR